MYMAKKLINTKEISHKEWLTLRKKSIGGSDAAAVVGMSQWASPVTVYIDKTSEAIDESTSEAMRLGTDLEGYVAQRFTEATGKKVRNDNFMYSHDNYNFITANIDRVVVGENAGLECKTMNNYSNYDFDAGEVPQNYFCQCQHYMAVMGYDRMYLCILVFQRGVYTITIERDQKFIDDMIAAEVAFWNDNVVARVMPAPDDSDATQKAIGEMWPQSNGKSKVIGNLDTLCRKLSHVQEAKEMLEKQEKEIKNTLRAELEDYESSEGIEYKVTYKTSSTTRLDSKKLKEAAPSVYAKYSKTTSSRTLRISKKKGA